MRGKHPILVSGHSDLAVKRAPAPEFSTSEIEHYWNVKVYPSQHKKLGWGFGKLDVVTETSGRRLMLVDSDTVFTGRVIDRLQQFGEELVVDKEDFSPQAIGVQFPRGQTSATRSQICFSRLRLQHGSVRSYDRAHREVGRRGPAGLGAAQPSGSISKKRARRLQLCCLA
jgi:hypothetical protein